MKTRLLSLPIALSVVLAGQASAQTAAAVPSAVTSAATAVHSACTQLQADELQLKINRTIADATALAASQAMVKTDRGNLQPAEQTLHTALDSYLSTDMAALKTAHAQLEDDFVQLKADAGNSSNVASDRTKIVNDAAVLKAAQAQLQADHLALANAGVGRGCGFGERGRGGHGGPRGPHDG